MEHKVAIASIVLAAAVIVVLAAVAVMNEDSNDSTDDTPAEIKDDAVDVRIDIVGKQVSDTWKSVKRTDGKMYLFVPYTIYNDAVETLDCRIPYGDLIWYADVNGQRYWQDVRSYTDSQPSALLAGYHTYGMVFFDVPSGTTAQDATIGVKIKGNFTAAFI